MTDRSFAPAPARVSRLLPILTLLLAVPWIGQGAAARAWLGVSVQDVTPELTEAMELASSGGALISDVAAGGPADEAGLRTRDVIIRLDGEKVESSQDLVDRLQEKEAGEEVALVYVRGEAQHTVEVTLGEPEEATRRAPLAPGKPWAPGWPVDIPSLAGPQIGVAAHPLDEHLAPYFRVRAGQGILILRVEPGSPADKAGVLSGDVIESFNGTQLAEVADLRRAVRRLEPGDDWKARLIREGKPIEINGRLERGWQSPSQRSVREWRRLRPPAIDEGPMPRERRLMQRLEREMEKLRDRIHDLEQELDEIRKR